MVGLKPGSETNHRLVEVLSTLFSETMSLSEKEERLKAYDVILTEEIVIVNIKSERIKKWD